MYLIDNYGYELPEELIAQRPADKREHSRLLYLDRAGGDLAHYHFHDLLSLLEPGDLLIVNNTKVIPGRLLGRKSTGGKVEALLLDYGAAGAVHTADGYEERIFQCLVKASKKLRRGTWIDFSPELTAEVLAWQDGIATLRFVSRKSFEELLEEIGRIPLPPYIKRNGETGESPEQDRRAYQTVYAQAPGAVAAPTAGLHFSREMLRQLTDRGVEVASITLHVGYGTFVPVRVDDIRHHRMHAEYYSISAEAARRINCAKESRRRVIAVGTTSVRTLEYHSDEAGRLSEGSGSCDLFIYPGYRFKVIDGLITNFHLPRSTLLMLVSALAGRESILAAYRTAIEARYRFFSYGDAMLIL